MWKSTYAARNGSGGETKTHLNKKEFRGPRKTFRTVPVYEEAAVQKDDGRSIHFTEKRRSRSPESSLVVKTFVEIKLYFKV